MNILFTGGSSFTGFWFIRELARSGHLVHATFTRRAAGEYEGVRRERVDELLRVCEATFECRFGDEAFLALIKEGGEWDLLCHHAADVTDYKSPDFDVRAALARNILNLDMVLAELRRKGCARVLLTGSVFENDEGAGSGDMRAFSPYGLSKALTWQAFRFYCARGRFALGKFVIPNPFGPYEEPRFTTSLVRTWAEGKKAAINTPAYVRDNIHAGLLALVYARCAEAIMKESEGIARWNPSGYVESQGAFTRRFADEMRKRLGLECAFELKAQADFPEPRMRINTEPATGMASGWSEDAAWDALAEFYREHYIRTKQG